MKSGWIIEQEREAEQPRFGLWGLNLPWIVIYTSILIRKTAAHRGMIPPTALLTTNTWAYEVWLCAWAPAPTPFLITPSLGSRSRFPHRRVWRCGSNQPKRGEDHFTLMAQGLDRAVGGVLGVCGALLRKTNNSETLWWLCMCVARLV